MLDFGALPPEINSTRMYAGPGPGSMLTAAAAWQSLADELHSAGASYGAVVSSLTRAAVAGGRSRAADPTPAAGSYGSVVSSLTSGPWTGPSAAAMAAAVAPYVTLLGATGGQGGANAPQATPVA